MRVEDIMSRKVTSCTASDSLERAAKLMWEQDCGCLPVCAREDGADCTVGIITDRDICMHALFRGKPLGELRVEQAMTKHSSHAVRTTRSTTPRKSCVVGACVDCPSLTSTVL